MSIRQLHDTREVKCDICGFTESREFANLTQEQQIRMQVQQSQWFKILRPMFSPLTLEAAVVTLDACSVKCAHGAVDQAQHTQMPDPPDDDPFSLLDPSGPVQ